MRALRATALAAVFCAVAGSALAHGVQVAAAPPPWTFDPWITLPLALSGALFALGWTRLRARSGHGMGALRRRGLTFAGASLILTAALVSPLHAAGERSFAAHMFEHELLMLAAAPLLVMSEPLAVMLWGLPLGARRGLGGAARHPVLAGPWDFFTRPVTATVVQAAALWLWHAPSLFDLALASDGWHVAQHLSFLVSALLFWSAMLHRRPRHHGVVALCLFVTTVVSGALGALMALSSSPWYLGYARLGMAPFGLSPLEDQQLAGLLMWIPGGGVHAGAALAIIAAALRSNPGGAYASQS